MVHMFFVLSGFVLLKCFHENVSFIGMFARRYLRLAIPIFASCLLCWALNDLKLNYLPDGSMNAPSPETGLGEVFSQSFVLVLFTSPQPSWLNQVQWTMPIEFSGSVLLMVVSLVFKNRTFDPFLALLLFSLLTWGYYQFYMLAGAWLYLLKRDGVFPNVSLLWKAVGAFFIVVFGSYPTVATPHHFYHFLTFKEFRLVDWSSANPFFY